MGMFVLCKFCFFLFFFLLLDMDLPETGNDLKVVLVKRLTFGKGELLEGHAWSSDDQIFAVAGCKIYLSKVSIRCGNQCLRLKLMSSIVPLGGLIFRRDDIQKSECLTVANSSSVRTVIITFTSPTRSKEL